MSVTVVSARSAMACTLPKGNSRLYYMRGGSISHASASKMCKSPATSLHYNSSCCLSPRSKMPAMVLMMPCLPTHRQQISSLQSIVDFACEMHVHDKVHNRSNRLMLILGCHPRHRQMQTQRLLSRGQVTKKSIQRYCLHPWEKFNSP